MATFTYETLIFRRMKLIGVLFKVVPCIFIYLLEFPMPIGADIELQPIIIPSFSLFPGSLLAVFFNFVMNAVEFLS